MTMSEHTDHIEAHSGEYLPDSDENGDAGLGTGNAGHSIAQSSAIAMQDATDNLRNLNTLSTTAIGVALSQDVLTGDPKFGEMIQEAQKIVSNGADNFEVVGTKVANVFKQLPK